MRQSIGISCSMPYTILGEIARLFGPMQSNSQGCLLNIFLEKFTAYLRAVVVEALDREQGRRRSIDDFLKLWRKTIGITPCFLILEMGMDFPDEVFYHPVIVDLADCITELMIIDNDMVSYIEQAAGNEFHNLISTVTLELGLDKGSAMAWAAHLKFRNDLSTVLRSFFMGAFH
ncbi:hypothetical protein BDR03DRAFT_1000905 [Suillus americanus]|nr:hypothetical protein BDR03DRAFT_1000905 [Suillus americanus]